VAIYSSTYDPVADQWAPAGLVTDARQTGRDVRRYVRTLGNPVLYADSGGLVSLFYVSVSVGRWSGSAVNVKSSDDGGRTWTPARRLILNPLLNLGTLVRTTPVAWGRGLLLPAYHELAGQCPELVEVRADGWVGDNWKIHLGDDCIQPSLVPLGRNHAIMLLRNAGGGITMSVTRDGAGTWTPPQKLDLAAPNSSLMAIRLSDGRLLLAFNHCATGRTNLSLAVSSDEGRKWKVVCEFPEGPGEYSYPCLIQASDGDLHVTYTWNRQRIKHVRFNLAWLEERT